MGKYSTKFKFFLGSITGIFFITLFIGFKPLDTTKIGFSLGNVSSNRWKKDRMFFEKTVKGLGGDVYVLTANSDTSKQLEHAKKLIAAGVKTLVVVPGNSEEAAEIVKLAHKSNIKVIAYDRMIRNCDLDFYISYDNEKVGELMAKYVVKQKPQGNYVIINGPVSDFNSKMIRTGQDKVLQPFIKKGAIKLILDKTLKDWDQKQAYEVIDKLIASGKKPDVVLGANDDIALGVKEALKKHNLLDKVLITGQDADLQNCREIVAGNITMTVYKPIKPLAYTAAIAAMSLAKHEPVKDAVDSIFNGKRKVPSIILTPFAIDKENMKNVVIDGHLKENEIYSK